MSDRSESHKKVDIDTLNKEFLRNASRLKALIYKLLSEITTLNATRPDSVPARYSNSLEEMVTKLDGADRSMDINCLQLKLWADEIQQTGEAVVRYLDLGTKLRPEPPGLSIVNGGRR